MKIPAKIFPVLTDGPNRLLDRLREAFLLKFEDARDDRPGGKPSDCVLHATAEAAAEYTRIIGTLRGAGGARFLGDFAPVPQGVSLSALNARAVTLCRKINRLLRTAEPDLST